MDERALVQERTVFSDVLKMKNDVRISGLKYKDGVLIYGSLCYSAMQPGCLTKDTFWTCCRTSVRVPQIFKGLLILY
jgi:hypothetical protein